MGNLARFGVSLDEDLLEPFDELCRRKSYPNRSEAIREEYAKLGIEVDTSEADLMKIRGGKVRAARTQSHGDHRMAMSLAVAALRSDEAVEIEGAESVAKSYPGFFEDLEHIRV